MGLAALSYYGCFSALYLFWLFLSSPSACVSFRGSFAGSRSCCECCLRVSYVCQCRMKVTAVNIEKGSTVESTHKVTRYRPATTTRNTGQTGAVTAVASLGGLTHRRGYSRILPPPPFQPYYIYQPHADSSHNRVTIAKGSVESCFHGGFHGGLLSRVVRTLINTTHATVLINVGVF